MSRVCCDQSTPNAADIDPPELVVWSEVSCKIYIQPVCVTYDISISTLISLSHWKCHTSLWMHAGWLMDKVVDGGPTVTQH